MRSNFVREKLRRGEENFRLFYGHGKPYRR